MTQTAHTLETIVPKAVHLPYLLFLPGDYGRDPGRRWPLILFLHGAGERGSDFALVRRHGIAKVVEQCPDLPFITVSPQCPADSTWMTELDGVVALLDDVIARYAVDTDRLYLTGLSMGGYGTWYMAALHPDRFAAIVPICGGGDWFFGFPGRVRVLKHLPVWAFHGAEDPLVPLEESQRLVRVLEECGGDVRLTVYPGVGHDSWTKTYDNPELYSWLLSHRRAG
ncbi:MAG TPA: prolyl oligopeptidase family serine peptidase [Anaerolineae bacterium]|nr:prolyl oligopeptidase family serine peptidase [Anaerolineae bacterium]